MSRVDPQHARPTLDEAQALRARVADLERMLDAYQRAERIHQQNEDLHRRIAESMLGGLVRIGLDGAILDANATALRFLDLKYDELTARFLADFATETVHENGSPYLVEDYPVSRCLRTRQPQPPELIGVKRRDGETVWAIFSAAPLIDPHSNELTGAVLNFLEVTEQRRTTRALRELEDRYQRLFASIPAPMYVADRQTLDFVAVNDAMVQHYGYSREEFLAMKITDIRTPDQIEPLLRRLGELGDGLSQNGIWRHRKKDGTLMDMEITAHGVQFAGRPCLVVLADDITQRRRAEEDLRASEERYRRLVEGVRLITWEYDPATRCFTFVSHHAEEILGFSMKEWQEPAFWYNHLHPDDRERAAQFSRSHTARGESHEFEYRMIHKLGHEVWFKDLTTVIMHQGKPVSLRGALIDITERKNAEQALRKSEAKYRALIETTATGYLMTDLAGRVIDANAEYVRLTGHAAIGELRGRSVLEWTAPHDKDRNSRELQRCAKTGNVRNLEVDYIDRNGAIVPVEINATVLNSDQGPVFLAMCRDISARKEADEALLKSAELQRMMLSELDHRVRNNLASLAALIDISKQNETNVARFAESIRERVQAMSAVHSLLSRARWVAVGMRSLMRSMIPSDLAERVRLEGPDELITPRQVTALGMMFQELIANSLKYGALRQTGGTIQAHWNVTAADEANERFLDLQWQERGGPPIEQPPMPGQGTDLILGFVRSELRGEASLNYPRDGASHRFKLRLDAVK